jgi:predicted metal-binding membrane protein
MTALSAWRLTRDQAVVLASLVGVTVLAWLYLVHLAASMGASMSDMPDMPGMSMGDAMTVSDPHWDLARFALTAVMWVVMMIGMMLPSAAPMILLFAAVQRRHAAYPLSMTAVFVSGYLLVWGGFAVLGAALQDALTNAALLSPALWLESAWLGAVVFLAAGVYEWSPVKNRCLDHCRGPLAFITGHWRPGTGGALRMGIEHGIFCLGCCWVLMLLLFAGGVMNLFWVAALALLVLLQKLLPGGRVLSRTTGAVMAAAGVVLLAHAVGGV